MLIVPKTHHIKLMKNQNHNYITLFEDISLILNSP